MSLRRNYLVRWNWISAGLGGGVWGGIVCACLLGWNRLNDLEIVLLLALLVITPLALPFVFFLHTGPLYSKWAALVVFLQPWAAFLGGVAFFLSTGPLAATFAAVWGGFTGLLALSGLVQLCQALRKKHRLSLANLCLAGAMLYLPVGGAWMVLARWGLQPLGFGVHTDLLTAVHFHVIPLAALIQASASGYYGDRGQELLTETSLPGQGFRARVCQEWEASTASAPTRRCIVRTGLVLDLHAGAFPPLVWFARMLGRRVGSGRQWLPWIHRVDVARAIQFLLEQSQLSGPFNLCAPDGVTNRVLLRAVQTVLRRPPLFPLPAFVLRAALGELATVMLDSQHLVPERLTEVTFQFAYPTLSQALDQLWRERL